MERIPAGSARLAADVTGGEKAPMVFLHAGVADRRAYLDLAAAFDDHATVAYDRRGFGDTVAPPEPHRHVDDLLAVLDHIGGEPAILVGNSQGGRIAIDTALAHPAQVRALVLIAPALSGEPEPAVYPPAVEAIGAEMDAAEAAGDLDALNELEAQLWLDGPEQPAGRVGGAIRALFLDMNGRALRAAPVGETLEPPSAAERLGAITVPTLVVSGAFDLAPTNALARRIAASIDGATHVEIEGVAHLPHLERHDEVVGHIRGFVDQLSSSTTTAVP